MCGEPSRRKRDLDVLRGGKRRNQVELLEDEAERPQPEVAELDVLESRHVAALEQDLAGCRSVESTEQL